MSTVAKKSQKNIDFYVLHRILYLTELLFNTWDKIKPLKKTASQNISIRVEGSQKNFLMEARGMDGEGNGNPLQYSCLENPMDGGVWWAAVHGVVKSQT